MLYPLEFSEFWQYFQIMLLIGLKLDLGPKVNLPNFGTNWPKTEIAPDRASSATQTAVAPPFTVRKLLTCVGRKRVRQKLSDLAKLCNFDYLENGYP